LRKLALVVVLATAVAAPAARADGDPASDYLLGQQLFVPSDTGVSSAAALQLNSLLAGARRGGYTVRLAIIASRYDLGSVTVLNKKPRLYAHFLSQELRFVYAKRVLVVMPNGYGIARNGKPVPAEQKVLDRLPPPTVTRGPGLAGAAARALRALATHAGVRIVPAPIVSTRSSGDTSARDRLTIISAVAVILILGSGFAYFRRRRTTRET
jgi:hypothetical protein